ncbi:hypothetical protein ICW40_15935 [Actinotalea ferrariae]|uniref:DUF6766 family protein n=1 Tax=Actinotalea ferrariae TaxID=1386098 RepID=UPI001C8BDB2D|nr:DUF6766 family protein [Actinotalea ferrariae]MBX9246289.1 hypothetical protein [Actinotalea ferrariae]
MSALRSALRHNGLTLFFGVLFVVTLVGQALTGLAYFNEEQRGAGLEPVTLGQYLTSSVFAVDVTENWQSEYLQFLLFILATVWLVQKGSPESKKLEDVGRESDEEQHVAEHATESSPAWARVRGWRLSVFSHSLSLVMGGLFLLSWLAQSITGTTAYNESQLRDRQDPVTWAEYLALPEFWNRTFQNWQSEFLAVASMVVLAIYLRERGSPESKPVGTSHDATGVEG